MLRDRSILKLSGSGTLKFLHSLSTQDLLSPQSPLRASGTAFGAFLSPQGRVLYESLFYVAKESSSKEEIYLDIHSSVRDKALLQLTRSKLNLPIQIESTDLKVTCLLKENINDSTRGVILTATDPRFARLPRRAISQEEMEDRTDEYRAIRIGLGVPEGPSEFIPGETFPLNMNLDLLHGVSFNKGCYVGQELTTRTMRRGVVRRRVVVVKGEGVIRVGDEIKLGESVIGKIISVHEQTALALMQTETGEALNEVQHALTALEKIENVLVNGVAVRIVVPDYFRT